MLDNAEDEAREEAYALLDSLGAADPAERFAIAIAALRIDPRLTDAHLAVAAACVPASGEALAAWLSARELARRDASFRIENDHGQLWSNVLARNYMRACLGHARSCLARGEYDEATTQLRELVEMDACDPLLARYLLGATLISAGRAEAFEDLRVELAQDLHPYWLYLDALAALAFKTLPSVFKARLKRAMNANRHVPTFLLASVEPVEGWVEYAARGSEEEAYAFAASPLGGLWRSNRKALSSLARRLDG
jgi:tetratricopeptide (TPR) repeat protein